MINTIKWTIFYRTHENKERSKLIFDLIYDKLGCKDWGDNWTPEQEDSFYEQIDLLIPVESVEDHDAIYKLVASVFGNVKVIKNDTVK